MILELVIGILASVLFIVTISWIVEATYFRRKRCQSVGSVPSFTPMRKNLVFTAAGQNSNIKQWLSAGDRNWDLAIVDYNGTKADYHEAVADFYFEAKGGKFPLLKHFYNQMGNKLDHYEAVWVADDDIIIDTLDINRIFDLRKKHDLIICQPVFSFKGKNSIAVLQQNDKSGVELINFIEMNVPCFEKKALDRVMDEWDFPHLIGWGGDFVYLNILGGPDNFIGKVALLHDVVCTNPFDNIKVGGKRDIDGLGDNNEQKKEWHRVMAAKNYTEWVPRTLSIFV